MFKNLITVLLLLSLTSTSASACDICGCGNGSSFYGILPQYHRAFVGMRYKQKQFNSHISSDVLSTTENFSTMELWTRIYPTKKIQILGFVPYHFNSQYKNIDQTTNSIQGLGDISVLVSYNLINTFADTTYKKDLQHQLLMGLGIKAPTGAFQYDPYSVEEVANANFQLGTGSWDFPINLNYTLKKNNSGLNINATYKINTENTAAYKFGNRTSIAAQAFKMIATQKTLFMPLMGFYTESFPMDKVEKKSNEFTGGRLIAASAGLETYTGKIAIGANVQLPISQKLSNGELKLNYSAMAHVTINI